MPAIPGDSLSSATWGAITALMLMFLGMFVGSGYFRTYRAAGGWVMFIITTALVGSVVWVITQDIYVVTAYGIHWSAVVAGSIAISLFAKRSRTRRR